MSTNPVSRARLIGSAAIVIATFCAICASIFSIGPSGLTWAAIIATIAIGYAVISAIISLRHPDATDAAWDEQNSAVYHNSLIFGFWAVLAVFIIFLALSLTDRMDPAMAFYWLGPVLGAVPPAYYVVAVLRGRAE